MNKRKTAKLLLLLLFSFLLLGGVVWAQASENYQLRRQLFSDAGGKMASTSYGLRSSMGQSSAIGASGNANYSLSAGYWRGQRLPRQAPYTPSHPTPADGATGVPITQTLSWQGGDPNGDTVTYTVAFGATDPPPFAATTTLTSYVPTLITDTTYYWIITATDGINTSVGDRWSFTTVGGGNYQIFLPLLLRQFPPSVKALVTKATVTLPQPLEGKVSSWCLWGWCSISPRLYHAPLNDGRTLVGWTDASSNGHISVIGVGNNLEQIHDFSAQSVRGLVAHSDSSFAVLLWDPDAKIMWLSKRNADSSEVWKTNIDGDLTSFNPGIGDSRLAYGNDTYMAYFAVHGDSGWPAGHEGDQLTYVSSDGAIQTDGWDWGCSHSMAELVSYHPDLDQFIAVCASDCYSSKGILINNNQRIYEADGNCGGFVSAQLGQLAPAGGSWKLLFNALDRPCCEGRGIALATIDGSYQSSYKWLTDTDGEYERDPVIARLGSDDQTDRYLVGWTTTDDDAYWLGIVDSEGNFLAGPEDVSSTGAAWGNRDDSLRTRADGTVSWVQGDASSTQLHLFRFDGAAYVP